MTIPIIFKSLMDVDECRLFNTCEVEVITHMAMILFLPFHKIKRVEQHKGAPTFPLSHLAQNLHQKTFFYLVGCNKLVSVGDGEEMASDCTGHGALATAVGGR